MLTLRFKLHPEPYALTVLPPGAPVPDLQSHGFLSVTQTRDEITVISLASAAPPAHKSVFEMRCLEIEGPFALESIGVVAAATAPLAEAGVSVFVISVWSTDFIFIAGTALERAGVALRAAGHIVSAVDKTQSVGLVGAAGPQVHPASATAPAIAPGAWRENDNP